jgi:hypothetical protein
MTDMNSDINRVLNDFAAQLLKIFREAIVSSLGGGGTVTRSLPSAPKRRGRPPKAAAAAAPAPKASSKKSSKRGPKSTPKEVEALQAQILDALKGGAKLSASEMVKSLKVDPGPFQYALGKLKTSGQVSQLGERRMAKYSLGGKPKGKPARKKTAKSAESDADAG